MAAQQFSVIVGNHINDYNSYTYIVHTGVCFLVGIAFMLMILVEESLCKLWDAAGK